MEDRFTFWIAGLIITLVAGAGMFWLKSMHATLKDIHSDLKSLGSFQAAAEVHLKDIYRRLEKLEDASEGK